MAALKSMLRSSSVVTKFWGKVLPAGSDECWRWRDAPDEYGYGRLQMGGRKSRINVRAHRVAAALFLRNYSDDLVVRHSCDNPLCCNPLHLLMGTQADNIADREARGRGNHAAKLPNIMAIAARRQAKRTRTLSGQSAEGAGVEPA